MKFFSKEKPIKTAGTPNDTNAVSSESNGNIKPSSESAASSDEKNVPDSPQTPMAFLAEALGIKEAAGNNPGDFFLHAGCLNEEEIAFWNILSEKGDALLKEVRNAVEIAEGAENSPKSAVFAKDMHLDTYITHDQMTAYGCIVPPIGEGKSLSFEELKATAMNSGIAYGINDNLLRELVENGTMLKVFTLAEGKPFRDGEDGQIIELYPREKKISFEAGENELIDYKNLNWLQTIHSGDTICKLVPAILGEDSINIRGAVKKSHEGKTPKFPMGKNTVETEDHSALVAGCDGQLVFSCGCFKVEQMIIVDADVDYSVGNLDVIGSITVNGSVFDGFTLKATVDIIVRGNVEGATLIAGGNIQVFQGINGSYKGKLEAGNNVTSKYLENCHVSAGGTVKSDSILNSTVVSGDTIIVISGKGIIIGSTIIAFKGIEARMIGSEQNILTNITVGTDPKLYDELRTLKNEIAQLSHKAEANDKNIQYLLSQESLDAEYQQLLNKLKLDHSILNMNFSKKSNRVAAIENELKSSESCQIVANQIYPPLKVTIENSHLTISTEERMCRIFKSEGEIIIGKK